MHALRILTDCLASGQALEAGRVYAVPTQVGEADAEALVRMGRAVQEEAVPAAPKPTRTRKRNAHA